MKHLFKRIQKPTWLDFVFFVGHAVLFACIWWVTFSEEPVKIVGFICLSFVCLYLYYAFTKSHLIYYRLFVIIMLTIFIVLHIIYIKTIPHVPKLLNDMWLLVIRIVLPYYYSIVAFQIDEITTEMHIFYTTIIVLISTLGIFYGRSKL